MRYCAGVSSPSFETSSKFVAAPAAERRGAGAEKEAVVDLPIDGAESPDDDHAGAPADFAIASWVGG